MSVIISKLCRLAFVFLIIFSVLGVIVYWNVSIKYCVRQTSNGPIEGIERKSILGQKYCAFLGVPFAEPPITGADPYTGEMVDRRFKAPEPLERRWNDPLKVHRFGKKCVRKINLPNANPNDYGENCLVLNIYVPVEGTMQKTVLVWIHGGGFNRGDSSDFWYGPDFLISQDNIVVTIQYRLGIFGFLNLEHGEYTGNMGLKDQQLALKWVYENIENFSGNRDEILLFGESAGGASVHFHMLNIESRKYFQRAFASSSTVFCPYAIKRENHLQLLRNCSHFNDTNAIIEYLKMTQADRISNDCFPLEHFRRIAKPIIWVPTIEKPNTRGAFLTKTPMDIYNSDEAPVMDAMFSFMKDEWFFFRPILNNITVSLLGGMQEFILPFDKFTKKAYPKEYGEAIELLKKAYFPNASSIDEIKRGNIALTSDAIFNYGILKGVERQAYVNNNHNDTFQHRNTFLFRFGVQSELNRHFAERKVSHVDDLVYMFRAKMRKYGKHFQSKDEIYQIIMRMVKMITNFARTGNPSIEDATQFKSCQLPDEIFCQEITNNPWSNVTTNIKEQLHYDTWRTIEEVYENYIKTPRK